MILFSLLGVTELYWPLRLSCVGKAILIILRSLSIQCVVLEGPDCILLYLVVSLLDEEGVFGWCKVVSCSE